GIRDRNVTGVKTCALPISSSLPEAAQGFAYDTTLALASGGGGAPYTWTQKTPVAGEVLLGSIGMELSTDGHVRVAAPNPGPTTKIGRASCRDRVEISVVDD